MQMWFGLNYALTLEQTKGRSLEDMDRVFGKYL